jgi:transglutaminase-like putative cysteine protease
VAIVNQYLEPTPAIDCDSELIRDKSQQLTTGLTDTVDKAKAIFYFTRDEIRYNPYASLYPMQASSILKREYGYCVQKAVLLAALARAVKIPARLGFTDIRNHCLDPDWLTIFRTDVIVYHGFAELFINGQWLKATPAFDLRMCRDNRFVPVEFDGINHGMLHTHTLDGQSHIEYLKQHGSFADVPLDKIVDGVLQAYGERFMACWKEGVWDAVLNR